ncbi:hypothetical protein G7054_g1634 [Neopestalotiopsis clavispora]|nr:hypothetical protein G7054_g1634 [Neopestalotiopsis clavispora]
MSTDPQTWVFPPPGAASPPLNQTGNFGPVYPNDTFVLDWTPRSETPSIGLGCWNSSNHFDSDIRSDSVTEGEAAPFSYTFSQRFTIPDEFETLYCHFSFHGTDNGNSVVWIFQKGRGSIQSTFTSPASASSTAATPSSCPTISTGISTGAAVGIGVGVVAVTLLAVAAGLWFWMRSGRQSVAKKIMSTSSTTMAHESTTRVQPSFDSQTHDMSLIGELEQPEYPPARELHSIPSSRISELGPNLGSNEHVDGNKYRPS